MSARPARAMAAWSLLVGALAIALLVVRKAEERDVKAVALAVLAAVLGVLATRGLARRAICMLVALLAVVPLLGGRAVLVLLGTVLVGAGVIGALLSARWPEMGRRYEAAGSRAESATDEGDLWARIDRGDDPTT